MNPRNQISNKLRSLRARAMSKNVPFDLDYAWMKAQLDIGECQISGIPVTHYGNFWYGASVDRIDSNGGYTKDNCKIILTGLNSGKGCETYGDLYKISKAFIKNFEER